MNKRLSTIELSKENMSFSAGHFVILSSEKRENLHGHHYQVSVALDTEIDETGLSFDHRIYENKIASFCRLLDPVFLIPARSPYLIIRAEGLGYYISFHDETFFLLKRDIKLLPLSNITFEELAYYFLSQVLEDHALLLSHKIQSILIKVFSGPGQSGSARWQNECLPEVRLHEMKESDEVKCNDKREVECQ